jgi:hypothetical protein
LADLDDGGLVSTDQTTFVAVPKDAANDRLQVEVGDSKQAAFYPQTKVMRWDNEVNLSIRLVHDEPSPTVSIATADNAVVWQGAKVEARFYEIPPGGEHPEGASEIEIRLKERPATNRIDFTLNTKGVCFLYQPALTKDEIAEGCFQLENAAGSYAIYTSEPRVNRVGGKLYRAGKVGHIFRPRLVDAAGAEVWGELSIDAKAGLLTVTIPQDFLDKATYPIRHAAGLTIGYTTAGTGGNFTYGTSSTIMSSVVNTHTAAAGEQIVDFNIYGMTWPGLGQRNFAIAAYDVIAGYPTNRLAPKVDILMDVNENGAKWRTTAVAQALVEGVTYGLAWSGEDSGGASSVVIVYWDAGSAPGRFNSTNTTLAAVFGYTGTDSGRHYSAYATYAAGGGTPHYASFDGSIASAGALLKSIGSVKDGGLTPVGTLTKQTATAKAGAITSIVGSLAKRPGKGFAGTAASSGVLSKQAGKAFAGGVTSAGALTIVKSFVRSLSGTMASAGALTKQVGAMKAGTVASSGALTKRTGKSFGGGLASSGVLVKQVGKALAGTLTSIVGTLSRVLGIVRSFAGTIASSGSLTKRDTKALAGSMASAGTLSKAVGRMLAGGLASAGAVVKQTSRALAGAIASAGLVTSVTARVRSFVGSMASVGTLTKQTGRPLAGSLTPAGTVTKRSSRVVAGSVASTGAVSTQRVRLMSFAGTLSAVGTLTRLFVAGTRFIWARLTGRHPSTTFTARSASITIAARSAHTTFIPRTSSTVFVSRGGRTAVSVKYGV